MTHQVLIVDDDIELCKTIQLELAETNYRAEIATSAQEALERIAAESLDAIVTDLNMKGMNGIELCERIVMNRPDVPVIVITAFGSLETAIAAIRAGAYDFITKPFEIGQLVLILDRAFQHSFLKQEVKRLTKVVEEKTNCGELIGESAAMNKLFDLIRRLSDSDASVLISGETGTGKDLVAKALHKLSRRKNGPFVAINCAALPETLLESQPFGHTKGAFTDARDSKTGLFVQANYGTLFLDEIGEMPIGLQPKLLRALQERTVRPLGSDTESPFDVRIICATNRDIEESVEEGTFRADLFFRINVVHLQIPPLRTRENDLLLLPQHFIRSYASKTAKQVKGLSTEAAKKLLNYDWPGNVRELQNCIERSVTLTLFDQIMVEDLPDKIQKQQSSGQTIFSLNGEPTELFTMQEVERCYIQKVLSIASGNKSRAAQILGYDRRTLYRKLERYGLSET